MRSSRSTASSSPSRTPTSTGSLPRSNVVGAGGSDNRSRPAPRRSRVSPLPSTRSGDHHLMLTRITPDRDRLRLLTKVARLYHEQGVRQPEIATRLHVSQARVSRLLKEA